MSILANAVAPILAQQMGHNATAEQSWDLEKFFNNATTYTQTIGGAFLALIGIAGIVWGGFLLIRKLMGGQQAQQDSWFKIVALIIAGGAMLFGGMAILLNFAKGSKDTIESFGNGSVVLSNVLYEQLSAVSSVAAELSLMSSASSVLF